MTSVAVVILNYNGEGLFHQFLPSVLKYSSDAEVIVVDNGSTDQSVEILEQQFPEVRIIRFETNLGYCGGYNAALKQIRQSIVVVLNSDVEVTEGWLESPIKLLESDLGIAGVQPKILSYKEKNKFEYAGAGGGFIDMMGYPFCRGRIFNTTEEDDAQFNDQLPVFWVSGACMIIRRESFLRAGGFDDHFFAHMEEIDLCWRLIRGGEKIYYDGQSTVYHLGGGTLAVGSPRKTFYNFRNGLTLLIKNLSGRELLYKVPFRLVLDWAAALNFLLTGYSKSAIAVIKAHLNFLIHIVRDLRKRKQFRQLGYRMPEGLILNRLIVFKYFISGKRTYRDIKNPK